MNGGRGLADAWTAPCARSTSDQTRFVAAAVLGLVIEHIGDGQYR